MLIRLCMSLPNQSQIIGWMQGPLEKHGSSDPVRIDLWETLFTNALKKLWGYHVKRVFTIRVNPIEQ